MYDQLIELGYATVALSNDDGSPFWNNALTDNLLRQDQLIELEKCFVENNRQPTMYFENKNALTDLRKYLEINEYTFSFEDSWQFWGGGDINKNNFGSVKKAESEMELEIFLETFDRCYRKDDPQNPYGELGEYLAVAKKAWLKQGDNGRLQYFTVFEKDNPVAVSTLTMFDEIGYISNVGSLPEVRGKGFGKAATLYCVNESVECGNKIHCLATEEGHYPNEFYKRIGFETKFTAIGMTKANY